MLDPSMTLFGKRFQVNSDGLVHVQDSPRSVIIKESSVEISKFDEDLDNQQQLHKEVTEEETTENDQPGEVSSEEAMDESTDAPAKSETIDETEKAIDSEANQDEKESNDPKKQLKKPDKILPCPRCNSMDTKFCYYNNYNVNQPRHFCKNCQRYWTAGGTMRSVPVGAGRRKNKSSASRYSHLNLPETVDVSNGTVLTFGLDNPLSDRIVLSNDFRGVETGDDRSSGSTVTTTSTEDQPKQQFNAFANQMPCFQWPYMWNPAVPFYPSAFPMPIYPHPYWNGAPFPCNVPWAPPQKNTEASNPTASTPTLGKHSRDGEIISPSTVLIPKTLRIDDPDEAAKSSIWTTLGIKKDKGDPIRNGFFNSFQSKAAEKNDSEVDAPPALFKANPVALCRSFSFQERA